MQPKFYFWGPLLFHSKIKEEDIKKIKEICIRDKDLLYKKNLAGHLDEEYSINHIELEKILNNYLLEYKKFYSVFYGLDDNFFINNSWVNYMKKGDYNPPHIHFSNLSGVLFISVPDEIKKENETFVGTDLGPGSIKFIISSYTPGFITQKSILPETGDMFIFPANLLHSVAPFKSDVERISVAFNMKRRQNNET